MNCSIAILAGLAIFWTGCAASKATDQVAGNVSNVSLQLESPRQISSLPSARGHTFHSVSNGEETWRWELDQQDLQAAMNMAELELRQRGFWTQEMTLGCGPDDHSSSSREIKGGGEIRSSSGGGSYVLEITLPAKRP